MAIRDEVGLPAWRGASNLERGYGLVDCSKWVSFSFSKKVSEKGQGSTTVYKAVSPSTLPPTKQNQWKDLEQSKLCSRAAWPVFPLETYQCELALLGALFSCPY